MAKSKPRPLVAGHYNNQRQGSAGDNPTPRVRDISKERGKPIVVAVVGLTGSGKSEATLRFVERGFTRFAYSDAIYEEMQRLGYDISVHDEAVQQRVREELRKEFGMGVAADRIMPRVEQAVERGENVVIESLYSWSEYKITKNRFGDQFRVLAIYSPPDLRYARLAERAIRPLDQETARSRDYTEIGNIEKAGPIAMADWTIQNIGTKEEFLKEVDSLISEVLKKSTISPQGGRI